MKSFRILVGIISTITLALCNQNIYSQDLIDITDLGGTISVQYDDSPVGEDFNNLIDNNTSTKYLTFSSTCWIQYESDLYVVTGYSISSANDVPARDPKDWTLKASNDLTNWVVLDSHTNEDFPNRFQTKNYSFTNTTGFIYYRLEMTNNSTNILQLSEWELFGTSVNDTSTVIPTTITPAKDTTAAISIKIEPIKDTTVLVKNVPTKKIKVVPVKYTFIQFKPGTTYNDLGYEVKPEGYGIQVASFFINSNLEKFCQRLRTKGEKSIFIQVILKDKNNPEAGTIYRVLLGAEENKEKMAKKIAGYMDKGYDPVLRKHL